MDEPLPEDAPMKMTERLKTKLRASWRLMLTSLAGLTARVREKLGPHVTASK